MQDTSQIAKKLRNARFQPPGGGAIEKLRWINDGEADLLRSIGGSGSRAKFGLPSYSLTTGTTTGTRSYGPSGGMAVGRGAPGYGSPAETRATLARLNSVRKAAPPAVQRVATPVTTVPVPRLKPAVPAATFLGPNAGMINTLPQIGGTMPSQIQQAINGLKYGPTSFPGTPNGPQIGGVRNNISRPSYSPGPDSNLQSPVVRSRSPAPPSAVDQSRVTRHLTMGKPMAPAQRQHFSTYVRSPYVNGPVRSDKITDRNPYMGEVNPVVENAPSALEQFGPVDQYRRYVSKPYKDRSRLKQNPNYRVGDVFGPDRSQPRSPGRQRRY